jgi:hypothetical protein
MKATGGAFLFTVHHMTDNRKSGIALIIGSIGGIVTMAIHPVGSASLNAAQVDHLALGSAIAHSLALMSSVALVLGACGLALRLSAPDRLAFSALVVYFFAAVAIMIAAAVSGFIVPEIMRRMVGDSPAAAPQWRIVIYSIFQINQAFAKIYAVAVSIAMLLWSASILRHAGLDRKMAFYGCIVAPLIALAICSGKLRLDVHGMGIVALAQAIWFVGVGVQLCGKTLTNCARRLGPPDSSESAP